MRSAETCSNSYRHDISACISIYWFNLRNAVTYTLQIFQMLMVSFIRQRLRMTFRANTFETCKQMLQA